MSLTLQGIPFWFVKLYQLIRTPLHFHYCQIDPKYCAAPTEPVIHNGSQGTGTNGSEISDSDYQAEYPDEYHGEYQDDYPRDYQYGDQGIDY